MKHRVWAEAECIAYRKELEAHYAGWLKEVESDERREPEMIPMLEAELFDKEVPRLRDEVKERYKQLQTLLQNDEEPAAVAPQIRALVAEISERYGQLDSFSVGEGIVAQVAHQATIEIADDVMKGHDYIARTAQNTTRGRASGTFVAEQAHAIVVQSPYKFAPRDPKWCAYGENSGFVRAMKRLQRHGNDLSEVNGDPTIDVAKLIMARHLDLLCVEPQTMRGKASGVFLAKWLRRIEAQSPWRLVWLDETKEKQYPFAKNRAATFTFDRLHKQKDLRNAGGPAQELVIKALHHHEDVLVALIDEEIDKADQAELDPEQEVVLKHRAIFGAELISPLQAEAAVDEMLLPWIADMPDEEMRREHSHFFEMLRRRQENAPYKYMLDRRIEKNGLMRAAFKGDIKSAFKTIVRRRNELIAKER